MEQLMETEKEIKYYAVYNLDTQKLYKAQIKCLNENIINIPITKEIFDNIKAYNYIDGEIVFNENYAKEQEELTKNKEQERIAKLSLTKREIFLALYKDKGLKPEDIRNQITDTEALIEFDYANSYYRGNPLVDKIGEVLGYSSEDLDYLFENKKMLAKEVEDV